MIFGYIASRSGPHWELSDKEADRIAYRVARVDIKWGGLLDKYGEEVMLLGCLAAIGWPRLKEDMRIARERARGKPVKVDSVETKVEGTDDGTTHD